MKKLIVMLILVIASASNAATTINNYSFGEMRTMVISWTAEADGSFVAAQTNAINGVIWWVETDPGATAPTAAYDITLKNADGLDVMGGKLADRSATATEGSQPYDAGGSVYLKIPVRGPLTIAITNNIVNAAVGTITIFYFTY